MMKKKEIVNSVLGELNSIAVDLEMITRNYKVDTKALAKVSRRIEKVQKVRRDGQRG